MARVPCVIRKLSKKKVMINLYVYSFRYIYKKKEIE